ncbi:NADP-dependent oxidoreductase [Amnibacterium setariae]|uniref:NADP-dependent oxidoreductase n=1 Tax=Amnibacterium setariae TaxID=2306585 RepID=A0A3A1U0R1_9MICO|nr:NADP-dependent oxidoreductase [Amnibacterium setariae]RIX29953.1 NADP-dependent oxidoreductase [Amnibacterium setariae]
MRSIIQTEFGDPSVLHVVDVAAPEPLPTEVLVRVHAVGINPLEARLRAGEGGDALPLPVTLGWDLSGVVERAVTARFSAGDEVFGMPLFPRSAHTYAEYVAAPALHFALKPSSMTHVEAAALPTVGLTAWQGLVDLAQIRRGDRVLIHAGGGGVGHIAIQIAAAAGAHVITTVSGAKRAFVESLGANELIDYQSHDFAEVIGDVDVVLDTVGGAVAERSLAVLRRGGHFVTAVADDDTKLRDRYERAGMRFSGVAVDPDPAGLAGLIALIEAGKLHVQVEETFPFSRVADAHRRLESGHVLGKLVLVP